MATTTTITTSGVSTGGPSGQRTFQDVMTIASGVDQTVTLALTSGANTVTPPAGTAYIRIYGPNATNPAPNPASTVTLTVKGVTGDTGLSISGTYPTAWAVGTLPSTFVITASGSTTVTIFYG